ncbi:hypothetical protein [Mesorhizobium sp. INR15]|uniref:hypothetical protein n=1 Tax=Mesorhizobium sp. INR15 TaxID=2654248 RepID=UPI0018964104|nr:hypothetical protein [Mesorhizobium sp. INR15]QPC89267.1 hypothetical protein GA829_00905 [Mesorhizobium sp. INR15]
MQMNPIRRFVAACLLLPFLWAGASAEDAVSPDLGEAITGHAKTTYADLIRLVVPDLKADSEGYYKGGSPVEMRHIAGADYDSSPPEASSVFSAGVLDVRAGGKDRLAMLFDLGESPDSVEGYAVLALYDLTGKPKLLDAVNVATDRFTFFRHPAKLSLGDNDALMISSTHFNSSQGYMSTPLILARDDRYEMIDLINTFDENVCSYRRSQDLNFEPLSDGLPHAAIKATITDKTVPGEEQCDEPRPQAVSNDISVTYRWDKTAARYVADSDAFEKLAVENAKRF